MVETPTIGDWLPELARDDPKFRRLLESMDCWIDEIMKKPVRVSVAECSGAYSRAESRFYPGLSRYRKGEIALAN